MSPPDPAGDPGDAEPVWWWQLPRHAPQATVRMVCGRNALSEMARASKWKQVRLAIVDVLAAYALDRAEDRPNPPPRREIRIQTLLDWAQIYPSRKVQDAVSLLWREVLSHHRAEWEAEVQRLLAKWNDPASLPRDRRRGQQDDDA